MNAPRKGLTPEEREQLHRVLSINDVLDILRNNGIELEYTPPKDNFIRRLFKYLFNRR